MQSAEAAALHEALEGNWAAVDRRFAGWYPGELAAMVAACERLASKAEFHLNRLADQGATK